MSIRFSFAIATVLASALGVAAAEPAPAFVVQTKPVSRLLADHRESLRQMGGAEGDELVKEFEMDVKDLLGEKGFDGLDINRPIGLYGILREKIEDTSLVLVVPTTGEKDFLALLERIHVKAEAVKGKKGLYTVELANEDLFPKTSHLQFTNGDLAYITLNDGEPTDPKQFIAAADLFDNADQALLTARIYPGRIPEKLLSGLLDALETGANGFKMFAGVLIDKKHLAKLATTFLEEGPKLIRRYGEMSLKEVTSVSLRYSFDSVSGDTVTEFNVIPKAGTPLAKEIAALTATTNRFAGLIPKDAAVGVVLKAPLFAKEVREIVGVLVEAGQEELKQHDLPEKLKVVVDETAKGLLRSVKAENLDAAFALVGPNQAGKSTLIAGLSFDDTAAVEKALRDAAKTPDLAKEFEFDAAKVGGVGIHKVPLHLLLPEDALDELSKVFGEKPPAYLAFAKDAVFVGFGPDALDAVKKALAAKPGPAPYVDVTANLQSLQKFVATIDEKAGAMVGKHLGSENKTVSFFRVAVEGGQSLKVKMIMNVRYLPRLAVLVEKGEGNQPVNRGK
jgi:hypothetical protein